MRTLIYIIAPYCTIGFHNFSHIYNLTSANICKYCLGPIYRDTPHVQIEWFSIILKPFLLNIRTQIWRTLIRRIQRKLTCTWSTFGRSKPSMSAMSSLFASSGFKVNYIKFDPFYTWLSLIIQAVSSTVEGNTCKKYIWQPARFRTQVQPGRWSRGIANPAACTTSWRCLVPSLTHAVKGRAWFQIDCIMQRQNILICHQNKFGISIPNTGTHGDTWYRTANQKI